MKHFITLLTIILSFNLNAGSLTVTASCDKTIVYPVFTICYSYKYKGPIFTAYTITPDMIDAYILKTSPGFHQERRLERKHRASNADYAYSDSVQYDKGHLAPNSALNYTKEAQYQLYTLANVVPQTEYFNRVIWRSIERSVRLIAATDTVRVVTGVCYPEEYETIGEGEVAIPESFFKLVQFDDNTILYYIENKIHVTKKPISSYIVSVDFFNSVCRNSVIK